MSAPRVVAVAPGSPADRAGVVVGDDIVAVDGEAPRDVIRWKWLTDEADLQLDVVRGGLELSIDVAKGASEPLGVDVQSALFDQVRTCDNHCEFCFIYQLPPGLRKSLYLKDDDYRLSFLYGNFTTLTRFTEADLERVITEGLSPLNVSIHAIDPEVRAAMLRNRRGATSLRWLRALLDHGVEVHGQVVCCPGLNDGAVLDDTLAGVLDQYPELASLCVVPLGVSRYNDEQQMRPHTTAEAAAVLDTVHDWQEVFRAVLGHRLVFAGDEYYLLADRPFPQAQEYEGFAMHEDGVGMARTFEAEFHVAAAVGPTGERSRAGGFFAWADGADGARGGRYEAAGDYDAPSDGYRAVRVPDPMTKISAGLCATGDSVPVGARPSSGVDRPAAVEAKAKAKAKAKAVGSGLCAAGESVPVRAQPFGERRPPVAVLTGEYGARVLEPLVLSLGRPDVRVVAVENRFFGGTTAVTGLLVGEDLHRALAEQPVGHRYLLPDVCLSGGRFLDGTTPAHLPRAVEIVPSDGAALRAALDRTP